MINNIEELKAKFLAGECSEEELVALRDMLKDSPEERLQLFREEKLSDELKGQFMPKSQLMLAEQKMLARLKEMKAEQQAEKQAEQKAERHAHIISMWRRAAAIAIVCVLGGLAWFYLQHNPISSRQMQMVATVDRDTALTLPDGTKVWLNKFSSIKYPEEFAETDRKVEMSGEGYFEVTKNPHQPFIVESDVMSVKVLGTIFNFRVDKARQTASVSLLEGKVRVKGNRDEGMIVLKPGQKACVDVHSGSMTVSDIDAYQDAMWHEHKTAFNGASVNEIAKMLENIYNVQVIVDPAIDQKRTYSGVIKEKETIDSVLELLQNTLPIRYRVKGNKVFITK